MAEFKLVLSEPKSGKSVQREAKEAAATALLGKKIGDSFKGELIDLPGYEFTITGGSDNAGFPMRKDVDGASRKRITAVKGIGVNNKLRKPNPKKKGWRTMKGMRLKKTVAGNRIYDGTAQINLKVTKLGKENLFVEPESEAPAPAEETKKEVKQEEPKEESKKEEVKQEEPKEESKKEEPKETDSVDDSAEESDADKAEEEVNATAEAVNKDEKTLSEENVDLDELNKELKDVDADLKKDNEE